MTRHKSKFNFIKFKSSLYFKFLLYVALYELKKKTKKTKCYKGVFSKLFVKTEELVDWLVAREKVSIQNLIYSILSLILYNMLHNTTFSKRAKFAKTCSVKVCK